MNGEQIFKREFWNRSMPAVRKCLEAMHDISGNDRNGRSCLHAAVLFTCDRQKVGAILEVKHCPRPEVDAKDNNGRTPLHYWANKCRDPEICYALLDEGADINATDRMGWTPLHLWARRHDSGKAPDPIADALLNHGANIDAPDTKDRTPLHVAAELGESAAVSVLLDPAGEIGARTTSKADFRARDKGRRTPLHAAAAAAHGNPEKIKGLVTAGVEIEARDKNGQTPLHVAAAAGTPEAVRALLKAKADPGANDDGGRLPVDLAENNETVGCDPVFWNLKEARYR